MDYTFLHNCLFDIQFVDDAILIKTLHFSFYKSYMKF